MRTKGIAANWLMLLLVVAYVSWARDSVHPDPIVAQYLEVKAKIEAQGDAFRANDGDARMALRELHKKRTRILWDQWTTGTRREPTARERDALLTVMKNADVSVEYREVMVTIYGDYRGLIAAKRSPDAEGGVHVYVYCDTAEQWHMVEKSHWVQ